jgi:ABC-type glutathione transport system ATPase component
MACNTALLAVSDPSVPTTIESYKTLPPVPDSPRRSYFEPAVGHPEELHAPIPPTRSATCGKPSRLSRLAAIADRYPLVQWTTIDRSRGSVPRRPGRAACPAGRRVADPSGAWRYGQHVSVEEAAARQATKASADVPDIRLVGLVKRYVDVRAVDGVDLEILRGEFFTLLGPSGSGKTPRSPLLRGGRRAAGSPTSCGVIAGYRSRCS